MVVIVVVIIFGGGVGRFASTDDRGNNSCYECDSDNDEQDSCRFHLLQSVKVSSMIKSWSPGVLASFCISSVIKSSCPMSCSGVGLSSNLIVLV